MTYEDTDMYKLKKLVNAWFRTPPLTGPEENALAIEPTVRMMGTVDYHAPSDSALQRFPQNPSMASTFGVAGYKLPRALTPRTVGMATFKDVQGYMLILL